MNSVESPQQRLERLEDMYDEEMNSEEGSDDEPLRDSHDE
jgi:hypothetical protein